MAIGRTRPYTEAGIRRVACSVPGCPNKGRCQWWVRSCAKGGRSVFRPVCLDHDVVLNRLVLETFGEPDADVILAEYRASME